MTVGEHPHKSPTLTAATATNDAQNHYLNHQMMSMEHNSTAQATYFRINAQPMQHVLTQGPINTTNIASEINSRSASIVKNNRISQQQ